MEWSPQLLAAIQSGRPISEWSPGLVAELEQSQQPVDMPVRPSRRYEPGLLAGTTATPLTGRAPAAAASSAAVMDELLGPAKGPPPDLASGGRLPARLQGAAVPTLPPQQPESAYMPSGGGGGAATGPPLPPGVTQNSFLDRWPRPAAEAGRAAMDQKFPDFSKMSPEELAEFQRRHHESERAMWNEDGTGPSAKVLGEILAKRRSGSGRPFEHPSTLRTEEDKIIGTKGQALTAANPEEVATSSEVDRRDKEDRLRRFEMVKGLSDAVGSFHAPTASEILLGLERPPQREMPEPQSITQIREELAEKSDPRNDPASDVSKRYQELASQLFPGMDLSNKSAYELSDVFPFLDRAAGRAQNQSQFEARAAQDQEQFEARSARISPDGWDFKGGAAASSRTPSTQKDREALDAYQTARSEWEKIRELKKDVNTGPVVNAWKTAWEAVGFPDVEWSTFKANLAGRINAHIKAMTGAQMSEPEARRLAQEMPKTSDSDELFVSKLDSVMQRVDAAHQAWLRTRGMGGSASPATAASGARVLVRDQNGKSFTIPESQLEEALASGYTRG